MYLTSAIGTKRVVEAEDTSRIITGMGRTWHSRAKERMKEVGVTQEGLKKALGVTTRGAVGHYLSGRREPSIEQLIALAKTLRCTVNWLIEGVDTIQDANTSPLSYNGGKVPLIDWVQAGDFQRVTDPYEVGDAERWIPSPIEGRAQIFALRVRGPSMEPRFRDGEIIYVDPHKEAENGSIVVVRLEDSVEATFKQLWIDGNQWLLKALNPDWPRQIIEVKETATICGVVVFKGEHI